MTALRSWPSDRRRRPPPADQLAWPRLSWTLLGDELEYRPSQIVGIHVARRADIERLRDGEVGVLFRQITQIVLHNYVRSFQPIRNHDEVHDSRLRSGCCIELTLSQME